MRELLRQSFAEVMEPQMWQLERELDLQQQQQVRRRRQRDQRLGLSPAWKE